MKIRTQIYIYLRKYAGGRRDPKSVILKKANRYRIERNKLVYSNPSFIYAARIIRYNIPIYVYTRVRVTRDLGDVYTPAKLQTRLI